MSLPAASNARPTPLWALVRKYLIHVFAPPVPLQSRSYVVPRATSSGTGGKFGYPHTRAGLADRGKTSKRLSEFMQNAQHAPGVSVMCVRRIRPVSACQTRWEVG